MTTPTRTVGPIYLAYLCAYCGATCPNTWSDPRGYVRVGGKGYCDVHCERADNTPQTNDDAGYLEGGNYQDNS